MKLVILKNRTGYCMDVDSIGEAVSLVVRKSDGLIRYEDISEVKELRSKVDSEYINNKDENILLKSCPEELVTRKFVNKRVIITLLLIIIICTVGVGFNTVFHRIITICWSNFFIVSLSVVLIYIYCALEWLAHKIVV